MKLLSHSQISTVQPLKFGNGWASLSHTLQGMWLRIHAGKYILARVSLGNLRRLSYCKCITKAQTLPGRPCTRCLRFPSLLSWILHGHAHVLGYNTQALTSWVRHICVRKLVHHWFRYWLVACAAPIHHLDQCWIIIALTLGNNFPRYLMHDTNMFIQEWIWRWRLQNGAKYCLGLNALTRFDLVMHISIIEWHRRGRICGLIASKGCYNARNTHEFSSAIGCHLCTFDDDSWITISPGLPGGSAL